MQIDASFLDEIDVKLYEERKREFARQYLMTYADTCKESDPQEALIDILTRVGVNWDDLVRVVTAEVILKYAYAKGVIPFEAINELLRTLSFSHPFSPKYYREVLLRHLSRAHKKVVGPIASTEPNSE